MSFTFDLTPLAPLDANNYAPTKGGFAIQAAAFDRAKRIDIDRVMLTALATDTNIAGSGVMARCDLTLSVEQSLGTEGSDAWYARWFAIPDEFQWPTWQPYNLGGYHSDGPGPAANYELRFARGVNDTDPGVLSLAGFGGDPAKPWQYGTQLPIEIERYRKYKIVDHIRWASDSSGFVNTWLDDKLVLLYAGSTLFVGQSAYLKLANYRLPPTPSAPSSVIHWLPKIGRTESEVS